MKSSGVIITHTALIVSTKESYSAGITNVWYSEISVNMLRLFK